MTKSMYDERRAEIQRVRSLTAVAENLTDLSRLMHDVLTGPAVGDAESSHVLADDILVRALQVVAPFGTRELLKDYAEIPKWFA